MSKRFLIIIFFISIFFPGCNENMIDPGEYGNGDDYDVYRTILVSQFSKKIYKVILEDSTFNQDYFDSSDLEDLNYKIPGLFPETIRDFIDKNRERIKLKRISGFDNYIFRSEYIETKGIKVSVWLSRIGYNKAGSQAVLSVGEVYSPKAAHGYLVFLRKSGSFFWRIESIKLTWIS